MQKKLLALCLLIVICISSLIPAMAHDDQAKHDADLKYVLFGNQNKQLTGDERLAFKAISNAAAIAIDQFSPNTEAKWKLKVYEELQDDLVGKGLPMLRFHLKVLI